VVGGLHSHDGVCADIRGATGLTVVSADYRLSPDHKHPAAFDDACAVARALAAQGPLILVGDSAGANLAAATCHASGEPADQRPGPDLPRPRRRPERTAATSPTPTPRC
jgi:acetyl esterase